MNKSFFDKQVKLAYDNYNYLYYNCNYKQEERNT